MEDTYTPQQAATCFIEHGLSVSRFHRRVNEGIIKKYPPEGTKKRGALYSKADVDRVCAQEGKKQQSEPAVVASSPTTFTFRPITRKDIGRIYQLQYDEYAALEEGLAYAVQPTSLEIWVKENRQLFWVAQDQSQKVVATIGFIPLDDAIIIGFLKEEVSLLEIAITDVREVTSGTGFSCYLIAAADRERSDAGSALIQLMEYLFRYWCEHTIGISMLYALASLPDMQTSSVMVLLRSFFFSRRRDLSPDPKKSVWELPVYEINPSSIVQEYQRCLEEKKMLLIQDTKKEPYTNSSSDPTVEYRLFGAPLTYREVRSQEEIITLVRMSARTFVSPGTELKPRYPEIENAWIAWWQQNAEVFHVVECREDIIGFISLIPLSLALIDRIMRGEKPIAIIQQRDIQPFAPGEPLSVYVHNFVVKQTVSREQKSYAGAKMLRELARMFRLFGQRGVTIEALYTRSSQKDGINISEHLGMQHVDIPGVTDKSDEEGGKRVFRLLTETSQNQLMVQYREELARYREMQGKANVS